MQAIALFFVLNALAQAAVAAALAPRALRVADAVASPGHIGTLALAAAAASLVLSLPVVGMAALAERIGSPPLRRIAATAAVLVATAVLLLLYVDGKVFSTLGLHLSGPVSTQAFENPGVAHEIRLGTRLQASLEALLVAVLVLETGAYILCSRVARGGWALGVWGAALLAVAGPGLALTRAAIARDDRLATALPWRPAFGAAKTWHLDFPRDARVPRLRSRKNVLIIMVESWRSDALSPELTPALERFRSSHACLESAAHYSNGHSTEYGVFSTLYGLNAYNFNAFRAEKIGSFPLRALHENGYRLIGASASALRRWNGAGFMLAPFDEYRELDDEGLVSWVESRFGHGKPGQPFFLFLFFGATHYPYSYPAAFERHRPALALDRDLALDDIGQESLREPLSNRYRNSVGYVDSLIGRVLATFKAELARGELDVVITGDHGEELWDAGLLGHAATRFIDPRIRVPLVLCLPGTGPRRVALSSHADLLPTLLEHLGAAPQGAVDGCSLLRPRPEPSHVVVSGSGFPRTNRELAWITPTAKYWLQLHDDSSSETFQVERVEGTPAGQLPVSELEAELHRFLKRD